MFVSTLGVGQPRSLTVVANGTATAILRAFEFESNDENDQLLLTSKPHVRDVNITTMISRLQGIKR